jgi:hypothetical protein
MSSTALEALAVAIGIAAAITIVALDSVAADVVGGLIAASAGILFTWALVHSIAETGD